MCVCSSMVQRDCALIMDAVRRLRNVLWNLEQEDREITHHLLPQIRSALMDHITFEERLVFPELCKRERRRHAGEHAQMTTVLWALEQALGERSAERCRALLDVLFELLKQHQEEALAQIAKDPEDVTREAYVMRLIHRSQQLSLEVP